MGAVIRIDKAPLDKFYEPSPIVNESMIAQGNCETARIGINYCRFGRIDPSGPMSRKGQSGNCAAKRASAGWIQGQPNPLGAETGASSTLGFAREKRFTEGPVYRQKIVCGGTPLGRGYSQ